MPELHRLAFHLSFSALSMLFIGFTITRFPAKVKLLTGDLQIQSGAFARTTFDLQSTSQQLGAFLNSRQSQFAFFGKIHYRIRGFETPAVVLDHDFNSMWSEVNIYQRFGCLRMFSDIGERLLNDPENQKFDFRSKLTLFPAEY